MSRWKQIKNFTGSRSFIREDIATGYKTHSNTSLVRVLNKLDRQVDDLTEQLADANKILREMEIYLCSGSKQTSIYQGSGFHKDIRGYFAALPQEDS